MTEALFYEKTDGDKVKCALCPHRCLITEGGTGICGARRNIGGVLYSESYGQISSLADDPLTKKPLNNFYPTKRVLSAGSYGCNLRCPFCQNHRISMERPPCRFIPPDELVSLAEARVSAGNVGLAFTYNEPFINFEYLLDCARLIKRRGLKTVLVTNGYVLEEPLALLLPYVDAMNIDLKSFDENFYKMIGGTLGPVKKTIEASIAACHVEVTTLVIPGENDGDDEMSALAGWLASLDKNCPLHISRFIPRYKMADKKMTPRATIDRLADVARDHLTFVYKGNV